MKILILETSGEKNYLIWEDTLYPLPGGSELSKQLAVKVKEILSDAKPDLIAVGTGPGSYTGVRVGVALAKALAYGWQISLLPFCSLRAFNPPVQGDFALLVDARMGGFYALCGKKEGEAVFYENPSLISPTSLPPLPLFSPQVELVQKRTPLPITPIEIDPAHLLSLVKQQFLEQGAAPFELDYLSHP